MQDNMEPPFWYDGEESRDYEEIPLDTWVIREGTEIPIKSMRTSHIKNCIRMIVRKEGWREEFLKPLLVELINRNEL